MPAPSRAVRHAEPLGISRAAIDGIEGAVRGVAGGCSMIAGDGSGGSLSGAPGPATSGAGAGSIGTVLIEGGGQP